MMKSESESGASAEQNLDEWAAQMLKRIGWHESNRKQIEMYANMPIAKKQSEKSVDWLSRPDVARQFYCADA